MAKRNLKRNASGRSFLSIGHTDSKRVYQSPTMRLLVQPSLFESIAMLLDFTGANFPRYNFNFTPAEADRRAIAADFHAIYGDFAVASEQFELMVKASA